MGRASRRTGPFGSALGVRGSVAEARRQCLLWSQENRPPTPCSSPLSSLHLHLPDSHPEDSRHIHCFCSLLFTHSALNLSYLESPSFCTGLGLMPGFRFCLESQQAWGCCRSACTPSTPALTFPPQVYVGWGWGPTAMLLQHLHLYEAQTPSLRSLDAFTTLYT